MKRREFLAASTALGLSPLAMSYAAEQGAAEQGAAEQGAAEQGAAERSYLELRMYQVESEEQRKEFESFAREAAIPALNRAGIKPVGIFYPETDLSPIYVLLPHKSLESAATLVQRPLAHRVAERRRGLCRRRHREAVR